MKSNNHSSVKLEIAASQNIEEKNHWLNVLSGELTKSFFPYDFNRVSTGAVRIWRQGCLITEIEKAKRSG